MTRSHRLTLLAALAAGCLLIQRADGLHRLMKVREPRECPKGLKIESQTLDGGMIGFDVTVDAEEIAQPGELYRGRVRSHAYLDLSSKGKPLGFLRLHGSPEGRRTGYWFRLTPDAARESELQVGTALFEKDGHPTLGGGVTLQITLAAFLPAPR